MDYGDCHDMWKTRQRKLGNNTYLVRENTPEGPVYGIQLHGTEVVRYYPDGSVTLHTGGYRTQTTKSRINSYVPSHLMTFLCQRNHRWYVQRPPRRYPIPLNELSTRARARALAIDDQLEFEEGMRLVPYPELERF